MPINNVVGSPVLGDNFYGRVQEQALLWSRLKQDNVLLLAPRRVGKTSLLRRVEATAEQHGRQAIYVSVADCTTEVGFLAQLYDAVARTDGGTKAARAALRRLVRRFPKVRKIDIAKIVSAEFAEGIGDDWQGLGEEFVETLRTTEHHWLFLIDELPLFVLALLRSSRDRARTFLAWFREARIDERARDSVRWVMAGSIGLDTVAAKDTPANQAFLLDALESDGYLVRTDGRYHFRSPLLRDYWRERVL